MRRGAAWAVAAAALLGIGGAARAQASPSFVPLASGQWDHPIYLAAPPRDPSRIFVVQRGGLVRVVVDGTLLPQPFADLTGQVGLTGERGLLSVAFPPDYERTGLAYVYLATPSGELQVRELRRSASDPNVSDGSQRIVWRQAHDDAATHNGATIQFGPDGMLWIATGDGGGSDDQFGHAEDVTSQLGKLLRIDPHRSAGRSYTVPADNPYAGASKTVWAIGLRNPFRFSFDRGTGDLVIGDVGQDAREEIDWARFDDGLGRRANYGWPCYEGFAPGPKPCTPADYLSPVFDYSHTQATPSAVTGGYVVRDPGLPTLVGRYVYADVYAGDVRSLELGRPATDDRSVELPSRDVVVSFGEDACGHLYVVGHLGTVDRVQDGAPGPCVPSPAPRTIPGTAAAPSGGPVHVSTPTASSPPPADTRKPTIGVRVTGRRTLLSRSRLRALVRTDEAAKVVVSGRARGVAAFHGAKRGLRAGQRAAFRVTLTRRAVAKLRRTLRHHRVEVALRVVATDAAGNRRVKPVALTLRRR